jgi:hypothetical protein
MAAWLLLPLASVQAGNEAATPVDPATAPREPLAALVAGLLAYTNWPTPIGTLRLCTWGQGPAVEGIAHADALSAAQRPVSVAHGIDASLAGQRCDAVYVAASAAASARELPRGLLGRPVLVIGEGAAFCAAGGMFCVEFGERALKFHANLDAIARSGLRINPQVLRIARQGQGGTP